MHLGAYMSGGAIEVSGNASDWLGGEMTGGLIRIRGNSGGQVGAAYRGSRAGMRGGTILVEGTAGLEVGMRMKRGTIVIGGMVRDFAGLEMKGGTIVLLSGAEIRTGAWMMRGTIVSLKPIALLPSFLYASTYNPTFLRLYAKHLGTLVATLRRRTGLSTFTGDAAVPGKGEILIFVQHLREQQDVLEERRCWWSGHNPCPRPAPVRPWWCGAASDEDCAGCRERWNDHAHRHEARAAPLLGACPVARVAAVPQNTDPAYLRISGSGLRPCPRRRGVCARNRTQRQGYAQRHHDTPECGLHDSAPLYHAVA